jgi:hypothetical protein
MKPPTRLPLYLALFGAALLTFNTASCWSGGPNGTGYGDNGGDNGGGAGGSGGTGAGAGGSGGSSGTDGGDDSGMGQLPFAPDSPNVYVAKVKNLLVGLPPTDQEIQTVTQDPTQLGSLVDQWMQLPEYQTKMLRFFELAFQQTQVAAADFENQLNAGQLQLDPNNATQALMVQNQQEVFARTMLSLAAAGQPFNQAMSTQTYMMTTAMKVFYALTDVWQLDDSPQGFHDSFQQANPNLTITVEGTTPIPLSQTLDPTSANYMHWYDPKASNSGCDPYTTSARANSLYSILLGVLPKSGSCAGGTATGQLTTADFNDWTMTTINQPTSGQTKSNFYDLDTLRTATTMILARPYVGFFTTPAFFANWQTNMSNTMRVTMNQAFIVSTGAQVDGTDKTVPSSTPGLDTVHALAPCVSCHQLLDPSRSVLASTFSWYYGFGLQTDKTYVNQDGLFAFEGVVQPVTSIYQLGQTLANHPLVASGWAEKLCYYVDSEACVPSDPAFQQMVTLFQTSNFSWNGLVKAVMTSPITTHTASTVTATTNGEIVGVSRRDHLCAALNARLGFADVCGLDANQKPVISGSALAIVPGLPSDGYGRGSIAPVLPNQPSLFYRAGTENFCEGLAAVVIDNKNAPTGVTTWASSDPQTAVNDFATTVAGLAPSDPRTAPLEQALLGHFNAAKAATGSTATAALQSTFVAACMAPSAVAIGM